MANRLTGLLKSRTQEQRQVMLMLAIGFFMGVFIATYQVTVDSLFLNRIGDQLNKAFLAAGALGILSTAAFSFFQNRINFSTLSLTSVLLIALISFGGYWLMEYGDHDQENQYIFVLYAMSGPMTAVLLLSFWGTFGRLFNFRQSKRIIGWIDTGQLIAAIVATLVMIPATTGFIHDTATYLLICGGSILIVFVLMLFVLTSFKLSKNNPREFGKIVREQSSMLKILSDRYLLSLSLFLLISMTMLMFGQYTFQQLVIEQYEDVRELTNFNSFFTGAVYGLSLIMQTFINNRIITNYGLRVSLFILPIVVGLFTVGALITGTLFGFDKASSTGFLYFFLFVALTRLFNWTIRDSMENPVFKLFFIPLDSRFRFNIQSKVEGMVNESSRFVAGLLIFAFAFIPFFNILFISVLILILAVAYFFVVNNMYGGYRNKIRLKLESTEDQREQQEKLEKGFARVTSRLERMLTHPASGKAVFSFKLLEKINASQLPAWINSMMKNEDEVARHYAQERMNELKGLSVSDQYVIRQDQSGQDKETRNLLTKLDLQSIIESGGDITKARIQKLSRSIVASDRQYAAELMLHTDKDECTSYLMELLTDSEPKVRNTAIKTSVKKYNAEVINALIENLGNPAFSYQAANAIEQIGAITLPALETAFYRSGQNTQVMLKLVQVMGRIGGQKAKELLWSKIDYPDKVVVSQVLLSLGEAGFKAGISQITRIKYAIEADMADIRWNLSAIGEIGDEGFAEHIRNSLRWEIQNDIQHIYMLLAMLYDTRSIQLVKENIDSGTAEGIAYAVELLDVFLSDQLKQRVIPILDDLSDNEKINRLDDFYPRFRLDDKLVLKFIINRDFTQSNRWTKACVLFQIGLMKVGDFKLDLIAQLFNPDLLIREVAAWSLNQIDGSAYATHVKRLGDASRKALDEVMLHGRKMMLFEQVQFFQKVNMFDSIPGITLSYLADISEEIRIKPGQTLVLDDRLNSHFFIIVSGDVALYQKGESVATYSAGQFIGEMLAMPNFLHTNILSAKTDAVILKLDKEQFYALLSDNVNLADKITEFIA